MFVIEVFYVRVFFFYVFVEFVFSFGEFYNYFINFFMFGKCKSSEWCKCWEEEENYYNDCKVGII